jgi:hypothetical protein
MVIKDEFDREFGNFEEPYTPAGILSKKSRVSDYNDSKSKHVITENHTGFRILKRKDVEEHGSNPSLSFLKKPSAIALVPTIVSKEVKKTTFSLPGRQEQIMDIATLHPAPEIITLSKKQRKSPFNDEFHIQQADYKEILADEEEPVQKRVTRNELEQLHTQSLKIRHEEKSKPSQEYHWGDNTLKAIDDTVDLYITNPAEIAIGTAGNIESTIKRGIKKQTKELYEDLSGDWKTNHEVNQLREEYRKKQKEINKANKRIDKLRKAQEEGVYLANTNVVEKTLDRAKKVQKAGNRVLTTAKPIIVSALKTVDDAAEAFDKSTIGKNIHRQAEADYAHMKSVGRRTRAAIAATGNIHNKRTVTVGALTTQKNDATNPHGISAKYEITHSAHGRVELHYYYKNQRISHTRAERLLTRKQIYQLKRSALLNYPTDESEYASVLAIENTKTKSGLYKKRSGNPLGNNTETHYGLIQKRKIGAI